VSTHERDGLAARIRQLGRSAPAIIRAPATTEPDPDPAQVHKLEARVAHLEHMVEGLQDSVHRESERQGRRIEVLETQLRPGALGAALTRDARERGL
jgi:hypothetical protein